MSNCIIKNAKICFPDRIQNSDLWIKDGKIFRIENNIDDSNIFTVIDAKGEFLLPGFIDIHTHLDDQIGDYVVAENYLSGSKIALLNGITTLYSFITQRKEETLSESIFSTIQKTKKQSFCNIGWHITPINISEDSITEIISWIKKGFRTIKLYTTYKESNIFSTYDQIKYLANKLKEYDISILVHCEDENILSKIEKRDIDNKNFYNHSIMRPKKAEYEAIKNIIDIAKDTGVKFHIVHVSSAESLELINKAKKEIDITCETGPHYLMFEDTNLKGEYGYQLLCTPPFGDNFNKIKLREQAVNGLIDFYATDHCAFSKKDKAENKNDLTLVPKGIPGIGALVPIIFDLYKAQGESGIIEIAKRLSENPARFLNLFPKKGIIKEGSDADFVILDTYGERRQIRSSLADVYDPYKTFYTNLNFSYVFLKGELLVKENVIVYEGLPTGELLC